MDDSLINRCPRCNTGNILVEVYPVRKLKKGSLHHENGDQRNSKCAFCGWWSTATYSSIGHKKGRWQYKYAPKITAKQRDHLKERVRVLEFKQNEKNGLKGV